MTREEAFPALLEICQANGLDAFGWQELGSNEWVQIIRDELGRAVWTLPIEHARPEHLAAVCFEVAKWLRDEHCEYVYEHLGKWHKAELGRSHTDTVLNADSEPAALVAACREVGK